MDSLFDFSRQISDLKRNKKFSEALVFFKEKKKSFTNEQLSGNEYLVSDILTCLRQTNHIDAGFQFLKVYGIEINGETKERIVSAYGWLLWSKYKIEQLPGSENDFEYYFLEDEEDMQAEHNIHYNKSELIDKIEKVLSLLFRFNNAFNQTLISNLISIVFKSEKRKTTPNWALINDFCNTLDPLKLSTHCDSIKVERRGEIIEMELASDIENWYAYKTKALAKLGKWEECLKTSLEALERIQNFHYSNDAWFSRRVALSKRSLGNIDETIVELESILRRKKEWFIQKELSELYFEKGNIEKAYNYAIQAINNFGPLEFKVDLLLLMEKILFNREEFELAFKHISLSSLIRQSEGWRVPQRLIDELLKYSLPEIKLEDMERLKSELKNFWKNSEDSQKQKKSKLTTHKRGTVIKIMHDNERGKAGFLTYDDLKVYFSMSSIYHLTPQVKVGSIVEFKITSAEKGAKDYAKITKVLS